jgi:hypothetical protein
MAVKSVIEIDVKDDAFKAFVALFEKYQSALKDMPANWSDVADSASGLTATITKSGDRIGANVNLITKQTEEHRKLQRQIEASNRAWAEFGRGTVRVAATIRDISFNILKWGAVSGLVTGVGGLFGYRALAESSAGARRGALGLGVTSGEFRAANVTYERIGGAGDILSRIAELKESPEGIALLQRLGLSQADISNRNAAQLLPQVLSGLRGQYLGFAPELRGPLSETFGLTQLADLEKLRRIGGLQEGELPQLAGQFSARSRELAVSDAVDRRYEDFLSRLGTASERLKTTLIDRLVDLSEPLSNVIDAFTNLIKSGLNTPEFQQGIKSFADYIQELSTWIGSEEAKRSLREFATNVSNIVGGLVRMAEWLASWFPERQPETYGPPAPLDRPGSQTPQGTRRNANPGRAMTYGERTTGAGVFDEHFSALERQYNLPSGLLDTVYDIESSRGRRLGPSRAGALGPFQFMPGTARQYGLIGPDGNTDRLMDTAASADASARYFRDLLAMFNNDIEMAAAAYNWGPGNLREHITRQRERWRETLPEETTRYLERLRGAGVFNVQNGQTTTIILQNSTGGNVNTVVNSLGAQGIPQ